MPFRSLSLEPPVDHGAAPDSTVGVVVILFLNCIWLLD